MKKINYIFMAGLVILMAGCGAQDQMVIQDKDAVKVTVQSAEVSSHASTVSVSGKIEAGSSANISTRMMGTIMNVLVKPGDFVKKGDLLLTISGADLLARQAQAKASITQAKSALENAEKDYSRFKILHQKGSASDKELENVKTQFEMARANLEAANQMEMEVQAQMAYTNLRAPFNGVVANTFVKEGDLANPGMPLLMVEGTSNYEAAVLVPESKISQVQPGADVIVLVKSTNKKIMGKVKQVSPSARNTGGQFLVKITLDAAENILPGMYVKADIVSAFSPKQESSPMVAREALIHHGQLTGIYTYSDDSKAILRWIRTGESFGENVEILSGIKEGEQYIVHSEGKLFNGAKVSIN